MSLEHSRGAASLQRLWVWETNRDLHGASVTAMTGIKDISKLFKFREFKIFSIRQRKSSLILKAANLVTDTANCIETVFQNTILLVIVLSLVSGGHSVSHIVVEVIDLILTCFYILQAHC